MALRKVSANISCLPSSLLCCFNPPRANPDDLGRPRSWDPDAAEWGQIILSTYCLRDILSLIFFLLIYHGSWVSDVLNSPGKMFPHMSAAHLPRAGDAESKCSQPSRPPTTEPLTKRPHPSANWGLESRPGEGGRGRWGRKGRRWADKRGVGPGGTANLNLFILPSHPEMNHRYLVKSCF